MDYKVPSNGRDRGARWRSFGLASARLMAATTVSDVSPRYLVDGARVVALEDEASHLVPIQAVCAENLVDLVNGHAGVPGSRCRSGQGGTRHIPSLARSRLALEIAAPPFPLRQSAE